MRRNAQRTSFAVLEGILVAAMAITLLVGVARPLLGAQGFGVLGGSFWGEPAQIEATLDAREVAITTEPALPTLGGQVDVPRGQAVEALIPTTVTLVVQSPNARQWIGLTGAGLLGSLLAVAVLTLLFQIARTLRTGDPFVPKNAVRLYVIAGLIGIGGQVGIALHAWGRLGVLMEDPMASFVVRDVELSFVPALAGIGVALLAEIFRKGAALRAELDGLV